MTFNMDPQGMPKPVVLRRKSSNYPGQGKRIHGIVFDHPTMPKIMSVSSVSRPKAQNQPTTHRNPEGYTHGAPPALIHSPSSLPMSGCSSSLPLADASRQQPSRVESSMSYQHVRTGLAPNYGHHSTSHTNTRAFVSEGTSTTPPHTRFPVQQDISKIRYQTSQSQNVDTRVHFDQHQAMTRASQVSVNPEVVARHARIVTQSMSHKQYLPASQPEHTLRSPTLPNTRFYLQEHVARRNSTGARRHYPSNVNADSAGTFDKRHPDEAISVNFSRDFHYNVWRESSQPAQERHHPMATDDHLVRTSSSFAMAPTSVVVSTTSPSESQRSYAPTGDSTFDADQFCGRRENWNSQSVAGSVPTMASSTNKKDVSFYRPPSQTSETVTLNGSAEARRGSMGYTKDRPGYEETLLQVKKESTVEERDLRKRKSLTIVISDSEDEEELGGGLATSPGGDWEDSTDADVFPVEDDVIDERENRLSVEPVILLGGLISNKAVKVKSEDMSGEGPPKDCAKDCAKISERKNVGRFDVVPCPSNGVEKNEDSWKSRHHSEPWDAGNRRHPSVKESVAPCEQMLCTSVKSETKAKRSVDVDQRSCLEDFRVTVKDGSRGVVNVRWSSSRYDDSDVNNNNDNARTSNGERFSTDENRNHVSSSCCERDIKPQVKVHTECAKETTMSKCRENARCSERATRECDCGPSLRTAKCSRFECHRRSSGDYVPRKKPGAVSEKGGIISSKNRSPSPTSAFLTRQLSKLTNDEMQIEIKKGERLVGVGTAANTHGRETDEAKAPCGVCVKGTYATDKIPRNLERNGQQSATPRFRPRDECHCRSCDCSATKLDCPESKAKFNDVASQKTGSKPTGIVVGVKKDGCVKEPLISNAADVSEPLGKSEGGKTNGGKVEKTTSDELGKGFGLLQFSVVEKDVVGSTWRNDDVACTENTGGSRGNGLTSQQWQAYSVKLEKGTTKEQYDLDKCQGKLNGRKLDGREIVERNVADDMRMEDDDRDTGSKKREVSVVTGGDDLLRPELGEQGESGPADAKKVDVFEAPRKRTNSDTLGVDYGRTHSSEESKRQKMVEGDICGDVSTDFCESVTKVLQSVELKANHEVAHKKTYTRVLPRGITPQEAKVAASDTTQGKNRISSVNGKKSAVAEVKSALTADEWKEILVGRIEQVRESIEAEQTPWKTKNKWKVLKKLEKQLEWWDGSSSLNEQVFIARRLQFFQTMKSQYELMKKIGSQKHTSKKTDKINVLKVIDDTNEK